MNITDTQMNIAEYNELIIDINNHLNDLNHPHFNTLPEIGTYDPSIYRMAAADIPRNPEEIRRLRKDIGDYLTQNTDYLPKLVIYKINQMLRMELKNKKLTASHEIPFKGLYGGKIRLWKGDITTLCTDYIVNAANSQGLGCFTPGHKCIDNVIHANAGPQLREECQKIMNDKKIINTSEIIMTQAYELPSKYILHVVGPIYDASLGEKNSTDLCKSYINCLNTIAENYKNMPQSIAFCCISTGVFGYPKDEAADIAISTVIRWLNTHRQYTLDVVFCVYSSEDYNLYENKMYNI
jgi:O-acetyl-ADP-ribose deacetylase (regulator of RNase III)